MVAGSRMPLEIFIVSEHLPVENYRKLYVLEKNLIIVHKGSMGALQAIV